MARVAQPVAQFDITGKEIISIYPSIQIASRTLGICNSGISRACNGIIKASGGFIWRYAEDNSLEEYRKLFKAPDLTEIPNFPDYLATRDGRVFGKLRCKFLSYSINQQGYFKIGVKKDGKRLSTYVHRLVAGAFCERKEGCNIVNHLDGNVQNNHADNLEWTTSSGNTLHARREGIQKPSCRKVCQFTKDGKLVAKYSSIKEAATTVKVGVKAISKNVRGVTKTCKGYVFKYAEPNKIKELEEKWKHIPSVPGYQASNTGRIYSIKSKIVLATTKRKNGREIVSIKGKGYLIHRLVAEAFYGDTKDRHVLHIDGCQTNNHVDNLQIK